MRRRVCNESYIWEPSGALRAAQGRACFICSFGIAHDDELEPSYVWAFVSIAYECANGVYLAFAYDDDSSWAPWYWLKTDRLASSFELRFLPRTVNGMLRISAPAVKIHESPFGRLARRPNTMSSCAKTVFFWAPGKAPKRIFVQLRLS